MSTTFNGYPNFATWAVSLHIENDRQLFENWLEASKLATDNGSMARALESTYTRLKPEFPSPWGEILNAGFSEVDWLFIANVLVHAASEVPA